MYWKEGCEGKVVWVGKLQQTKKRLNGESEMRWTTASDTIKMEADIGESK